MAHLHVFKWDMEQSSFCSTCILLWLPHLWEDTQVSLHEGEQDNWIP